MRKNRLPELKRLAAKHNCTVTDDKDSCIIQVDANEGYSWEGGERSCQWTGYGDNIAEWRHDAIAEAIERLTEEPPDAIPYKHND